LAKKRQNSSAQHPDLDWSQVRETISMITLAVAQIESSMKDGEKAVSELSESFTYITNQLQNLIQKSSTIENNQNTSAVNYAINDIKENTLDIHDKVNHAIIAFQFYDRLTQRLEHAKRDLNWLGKVISDPVQLYDPVAWRKLQEDIASNYSMEEERLMFEQIMNGATVEEALEIYRHHFNQENKNNSNDGVELF